MKVGLKTVLSGSWSFKSTNCLRTQKNEVFFLTEGTIGIYVCNTLLGFLSK